MTRGGRDRLCLLGAVGILLLGTVTWAFGRPSMGLMFAGGPGALVVSAVEPGSIAWSAGAKAGMVVERVDGRDIGMATGADLAGHQLDLRDPGGDWSIHLWPFVVSHSLVLPALWVALALILGGLIVQRRLHGLFLVDHLAAPMTVAVVAPLALVPMAVFGSSIALLVSALAWPVAAWPLAAALGQQVRTAENSRRIRVTVHGALVLALALIPLLYVFPGPATAVVLAREGLVALALLGPIPFVVGSANGAGFSSSRDTRLAGVAALAVVPLLVRLATLAPVEAGALVFVALWVAAGGFLTWFVVVPLVRLAGRAVEQRNLVAAAADAERRRVAADLHDGPLQSLTLLAYRLDAAGDPENAAFARDVATELRAVTSALRLPVVDDLGAGQALEWLTQRIGALTETDIQLERVDAARPPRDVEHAIFRVAQEAVANATRHGRPPIRVRYEAGAERAKLVVDDSGSGMENASDADQRGLGLTGMRERANAVGGELEINSGSEGTRVTLVWPASAA